MIGEYPGGHRELVLQKVAEACLRVGRKPDSVKIIAVMKGQPYARTQELFQQGQLDFAENYVQEFLAKRPRLSFYERVARGDGWHFIGVIQSNKIRSIVEHFQWVHSLSTKQCVERISRIALHSGRCPKVLIQVKFSQEASKSGFLPDEATALVQQIKDFPGLSLAGLMVMPPPVENPEESRGVFRLARELLHAWQLKLKGCEAHPCWHLSMGTSQDYEVAIEEGATMIRLGEVLVGKRQSREGSL